MYGIVVIDLTGVTHAPPSWHPNTLTQLDIGTHS